VITEQTNHLSRAFKQAVVAELEIDLIEIGLSGLGYF
jgi:hypothetical protein